MQRFQLPFEPAEFGECEECLSTIYFDDARDVVDVVDGKLICLDCITALEVDFEFEMEEIEYETVRTKQCL
jgi:glucose-6-phosphate 1-dehydrogenase